MQQVPTYRSNDSSKEEQETRVLLSVMRSCRKLLVSFTLGFSALVASPSPSSACINAVGAATSDNFQALRRATDALDHGDYTGARRLVSILGQNPLEADEAERARWIIAMSYVRDEEASDQRLDEAVRTLREVGARRTLTDVVSKVDLGEALARRPSTEQEARSLLEPLAREDLIGSAYAYAALVRIGSNGHVRTVALDRCQAIAREASLCTRGFIEPVERREQSARRVGFAVGGAGGATLLAAIIFFRLRARRRTARLAAFA